MVSWAPSFPGGPFLGVLGLVGFCGLIWGWAQGLVAFVIWPWGFYFVGWSLATHVWRGWILTHWSKHLIDWAIFLALEPELGVVLSSYSSTVNLCLLETFKCIHREFTHTHEHTDEVSECGAWLAHPDPKGLFVLAWSLQWSLPASRAWQEASLSHRGGSSFLIHISFSFHRASWNIGFAVFNPPNFPPDKVIWDRDEYSFLFLGRLSNP